MAKVKEHKIGERFVLDHIIYEVRAGDSCRECAFYVDDDNVCTDYHSRAEACGGYIREDEQDVIFVQVGEEKQ